MFDFDQYLRDNPMPTKCIDNENYYIVECCYERKKLPKLEES